MSASNGKKTVAVIMAGGAGYRLWPKSTEKQPKQFVHLLGDGTMIQNTFERIQRFISTDDIYVVTTSEMVGLVKRQLPELAENNIIIEPFPRKTAPCLALSSVILSRNYDSDTIIVALPADHVILNKGEFYDSLEVGINAASELSGIVTIGVKPTRPETSFGYVQIKRDFRADLGSLFDRGVRYSTTFAEKPDIATARRFLDSGDFLWNSGIFILSLEVLRNSFEKLMAEDYALFKLLQNHFDKDSYNESLDYTYRQISSLSFDYAILEKADNVYVVQSSFRWSDVGNWDEIYRLSMKDAHNNVIIGNVIPINSTNCLISSNDKLIGIVDVSDLIVIDSDDALLICKRNSSDDVIEIVDYLRRKQINRFL